MDVVTIATQATTLLSPLLPMIVEGGAKEVGKTIAADAITKAKAVLSLLTSAPKGDTVLAKAKQLAATPDDEDARNELDDAISGLLKRNAALLEKVAAALADGKGGNNVSQEIQGNNNNMFNGGSGNNFGKVSIVNHTPEGNSFQLSLEYTFLSLNQMLGRLQEAANSGVKNFDFHESKQKIEELLVISKASGRHEVEDKIVEFTENYNNFIKIINDAISRKSTIEEVNDYHKKMIVGWFDEYIYKPNIKK